MNIIGRCEIHNTFYSNPIHKIIYLSSKQLIFNIRGPIRDLVFYGISGAITKLLLSEAGDYG